MSGPVKDIEQSWPAKTRFIRAFNGRMGGVPHIYDRQEGRLLCGRSHHFSLDQAPLEPRGSCHLCRDKWRAIIKREDGK